MLHRVKNALEAAGIESAESEARWLVEAGTGQGWSNLLAGDAGIGVTQERRTLDLAHRRSLGEPLQYIIGAAQFRHLDVAVGPGVFIPRPETEQVVDRALTHLPPEGIAVDIGTGSGAIALALAQERPGAEVWATEVSPQAFRWAQKNVAALNPSVHLVPGDLFEEVPGWLRGKFDLVVSNPPYVRRDEAGGLPGEVRDYEPEIALFAGGDGLDIVRRIATDARDWLGEGGWLVLEIGAGQGLQVAPLIEHYGYLEVSVGTDLAGRQRILEARR
ncbi:MAG: peptide chain release factor N(5)-glutamine methyltransferase [Actinomycetota bacterium]|nr:peptide chain release factor N(5)-glutamine methyltransferase [Actinomycetota bacterium]